MDIAERLSERTTTDDSAKATRALLVAGALTGPFFFLVAIAQILTRPGFDIRRHAISVLSLGDFGWIQSANFIVTGVLAVGGAIGLRRLLAGRKAGTWGPLLVGTFGVGTIVAGIFHPDPGLGFPPGAPAGMPSTMSAHATIHMLSFMVAFLSVIAACFVVARLFKALGDSGWHRYCLATGVITPVLVILGSNIKSWVGVIFAVAAAAAQGWLSATMVRLQREVPEE